MELTKVEQEGFRIAIIGRIKHGRLHEALRERGWTQKQGAEFVGMRYSSFDRLINLRWFPARGFSHEQAKKLLELTGKKVDELFPAWTRVEDFLETPKVLEIMRETTPAMLAAKGIISLPPAPDEEFDIRKLRERIEEALSTLPHRNSEIIRRYYLQEMSTEEIAREFGVSRTRINQLINKALGQLRWPPRSKLLKSFIEPSTSAREPAKRVDPKRGCE